MAIKSTLVFLAAALCALQVSATPQAELGLVKDRISLLRNTVDNSLATLRDAFEEVDSMGLGEVYDKIQNVVLGEFNTAVKTSTGQDFGIVDKWNELVEDIRECAVEKKENVKALIDALMEDTQKCATEEMEAINSIRESLKQIKNKLANLPQNVKDSVQKCRESIQNRDILVEFKCIVGALAEAKEEILGLISEVYSIGKKVTALVQSDTAHLIECAKSAVQNNMDKVQKAGTTIVACVMAKQAASS